jgi:hypothetical protein
MKHALTFAGTLLKSAWQAFPLRSALTALLLAPLAAIKPVKHARNYFTAFCCATSFFCILALPMPLTAAEPQPNHVDRQGQDLAKFTPGARAAYERIDWASPRGASHIVGFNYQPSWAANGTKCWIENFDADKYREELMNGKKHFPLMNTVRVWLNYEAWMKDPATAEKNVRTAFSICRKLDLLVMPVLTSFWGGQSWGTWLGAKRADPNALLLMDEYFLAMDKATEGGGNILVWDICNEPPDEKVTPRQWTPAWNPWLRNRCVFVRQRFAANRSTYSAWGGIEEKPTALLDAVDLWSFHPYAPFTHDTMNPKAAAGFLASLPQCAVKFQAAMRNWMAHYESLPHGRKPVIFTECCWGSLNDEVRASIVEASLQTFVEIGAGFLPHALQESLAPDLHRPEFGKVERPGFMAFVMMDGSLRPGHDLFNKYAAMASDRSNKPMAPQGKAESAEPMKQEKE